MSFLLSHIQKLFLKNCFCRSSLTKKSTHRRTMLFGIFSFFCLVVFNVKIGWFLCWLDEGGEGEALADDEKRPLRGAELADAWPRSTALFSWCHRRGHPTTIRHTTLYLYYYTPVWMMIRPSVRRRPMIELLTAAGATELWNIKHFLNTKYLCISHKFHVLKIFIFSVKKTVIICQFKSAVI